MKKYLISTLVILGSLYLSPCSAVSILQEYCPSPNSNIKIGTKCNTLSNTVWAQVDVDAQCLEDGLVADGGDTIKDDCLVYLCNNKCTCRASPCAGSVIVDPIEPVTQCDTSCFDSISWSRVRSNNRLSGIVNLPDSTSCSGCPTTVYRCASGSYTTPKTLLSAYLPDGVSDDENLECLPCPAASDDSGVYLADNLPSYIASPVGLPLRSACYIKANSAISTDVGTYEYTSDCKYTE